MVLHQLITGQLPFSGEDYVLMQKILNEPHPPLRDFCANCPEGLQDIVDRSLAKSVDDRYQTAEEMAADLRSVIEELGKEQVVELLPEARRLVEAQDYTRARVVLQQVLKVQSKHTGARELLSEIQRRIVQRQRDERLRNARMQAEDALSRREFDQSLQILKEGLEVDPANTDLLALRENVLQEKKQAGADRCAAAPGGYTRGARAISSRHGFGAGSAERRQDEFEGDRAVQHAGGGSGPGGEEGAGQEP